MYPDKYSYWFPMGINKVYITLKVAAEPAEGRGEAASERI